MDVGFVGFVGLGLKPKPNETNIQRKSCRNTENRVIGRQNKRNSPENDLYKVKL